MNSKGFSDDPCVFQQVAFLFFGKGPLYLTAIYLLDKNFPIHEKALPLIPRSNNLSNKFCLQTLSKAADMSMKIPIVDFGGLQ